MARPHITRSRAHIARAILNDEQCSITRPPDHDGLNTLNPTTLKYDTPDDGTVIYTGGCFVNFRPAEFGNDFVSVEALGRIDTKVRVRLAVTCPQLLYGDLITITATDNTQLLSTILEVLEDENGSRQVTKVVRCRLQTRTDRG